MSFKKETATPAQVAQFGFLLAQAAVEIMGQKNFSKKELQNLLTPPYNGKIKEIATSVMSQVLGITISIWDRQKEKLTKFWKEQFNHDILWEELFFRKKKKVLAYWNTFLPLLKMTYSTNMFNYLVKTVCGKIIPIFVTVLENSSQDQKLRAY